jgi:hypothetical protein
MLQINDQGPAFCDGLTRREWLRVGGIGLGALSLPGLLAGRARAARAGRRPGKARAVIVFGVIGGPSQYDTFDPKPKAPAEVRGPFAPSATSVPGLFVGELMPRTARLMHQVAVLRAVVTNDNAHSSSGYQMMTGVPHQPLNQESATPRAPNNWPNLGALVRALRPDAGRLPAAVTLPEHIWNDGNFPWPGQDAGFLGNRFSPWLVHCDPSGGAFRAPSLTLPAEVPPLRFDARRSLLEQVNRHLDGANRAGVAADFDRNAQKALELLDAPAARRAFDLSREAAAVRERYGPSRFAQSVLLARRLVEAGVCLVQVNWTRIKDQPNQGGWDTHAKHNQAMKDLLMPIADRSFSALLEDLEQRGLLDEVLVVWFGEFGRTPRFNGGAGRDHWGHCFSLALAGGGVRGGAVYGASDRNGAYPLDGRVEARDLLATIFHCLGHGPDAEVHDGLGRPFAISRGQVIRAIV